MPLGTFCFGGITSCVDTNYCGATWSNAGTCSHACPSGIDSECPSGTSCFGGITSCASTNYCGVTWSDAAVTCSRACPSGIDSDCPPGTRCFGGITGCGGTVPTATPTNSDQPSGTSPPSQFPSQAPSQFGPEFKGLDNVYSLKQGLIELNWRPPSFTGPYSAEETVYDIFIADGDYDFNATLQTITVMELIVIFENHVSLQHIQVIGQRVATINSAQLGVVHTVLVTAQLGGVYSSNTASSKVIVAASDPVVRDDVTIIGLFLPTLNVDIEISGNPDVGEIVTFSRSVAVEAQNLAVGNIITGFTSDLTPFVRRVVSIQQSNPELVVLVVSHVPLEDIFEELSIDGVFEASTKRGALDGGRRRLFFGDFFGFVGDGIEALGNVIVGAADNVLDVGSDIVDGIGGFVTALFGEEVLVKFELVDVHEEFVEGT
jgi:hypothetical protein